MTPAARHQSALLPLDEGLYSWTQQIGIDDDDELKTHLLSIQAEAYKVTGDPLPGVSRLFPYQNLLKLGREREGAIFLDIGCCFGTDVRKAIADGFPSRNVMTSDLHQGFWDLGHRLFKTTPDTFPVTFVPGDVFDPERTPEHHLGTLKSLNPLRGHVSAISALSFFHLFPGDAQLRLARALAGLLSPEPGSMIFGKHIGLPESGHREDLSPRVRLFCHTPRSWSGLWDGGVFLKGTVKVLAFVTEVPKERVANIYPEANSLHLLTWSVTRL
ncbi:hypothetical protein EDB89DRAFT_2111542 [Lactarius sanguifluus]|nr:hypothetical protein EDB89DRAFT_2111542 [Lactarius sanguifluus]